MELLNREIDKDFISTWVKLLLNIFSNKLNEWELFEEAEKAIVGFTEINPKLNFLFILNETARKGNYSKAKKNFLINYTETKRKVLKGYELSNKESKFQKFQINHLVEQKEELYLKLYDFLISVKYIHCNKQEFFNHFNSLNVPYSKIVWDGNINELLCLIYWLKHRNIIIANSWLNEVKNHFELSKGRVFKDNSNLYSSRSKTHNSKSEIFVKQLCKDYKLNF